MRERPSSWSIVWTDNVCYRFTPFVFAVLCFGLMVGFTGTLPGGRHKPDIHVEPGVAIAIVTGTVSLALLLAWSVALRVASIRVLFERNQQCEAVVRKIRRFRGGETLELEIERWGVRRRARYSLQRWAKTPRFQEGMRIPVVVDPERPDRAIPVALYARRRDAASAGS